MCIETNVLCVKISVTSLPCFDLENYFSLSSLFHHVQWVPDGRRLVTGAASGEFTLWNGTSFNFESILQVPCSGGNGVGTTFVYKHASVVNCTLV